MVSQQLFGECCTILEYGKDNWIKVKCRYDNYEGWCQASHVVEIDEENYLQADKEIAEEWVNEVDYNGHHMLVPLGSSFTSLNHGKAFWRKNSVQFSGKVWKPLIIRINPKIVKQVAFKFLNTAYLWGGKSVFGIDCSGFTQLTYKFLNIPLPRDAWQQAALGETVTSVEKVNCGDLAFFDNEEGHIIHVGLVLNEHEVIHSSGKVRLDKIDKEGIVNLETKQRTHRLKVIKRYF
jgi:hypothetical protein